METWYEITVGRLGTHGNPIVAHQYVSSTAHFLRSSSGRQDKKFTDWREFHPTWEAARDRLLELHEPRYLKNLANLEEDKRLAVERVEKNLAEGKYAVDKIKGLESPKETTVIGSSRRATRDEIKALKEKNEDQNARS